jgi:uncharacterized membrane protein
MIGVEAMGEIDAPVPSQAETPTKRVPCAISGEPRPRKDLISLETLRPALVDRIQREHPGLAQDALISRQAANKFRTLYVEELLKAEHGEFSELDRQVAESIAKQDTIAENIEAQFEEQRTFGESLSDQLASFGGSWAFLMAFFIALACWIAYNLFLGKSKAFDAYPFILLNLILSCLAAIQAPIIMMSQKRQEAKDRLRAFNDYRVNLKAELEIRHLHEKVDHLITKQWQRLAEIQQIQLEIMQESRRKK